MKTAVIIAGIFFSISANGQWTSRAAFPGTAKAKSAAFTIGNKIYVVGGVDNFSTILADFWEYDIPSDTWTQKPAFPGPERYGAAAFVINNTGYIACGGNDFGYLDDLWEFNPVTNAWTQRTGLPAFSAQHENQRTEPFAFSAGSKGYLGGGEGFVFMPNSTGNIAFYDLWEYSPSSNTWVQKADIPDFTGKNMAIAATINNKGYVGLGCNVSQTMNYTSMWEYDPALNVWNAKSSFPTNFTTDAGAFTLNSFLYVTGGVNLNPVGLSSQFYRYDPVADNWTQFANFNGGAIAGQFSVSTGSSGFAGTGYNGSIVTRSDVWEFTSGTTGIASHEADNYVLIYPDPVKDAFSIRSEKQPGLLQVYDVHAALVITVDNTFTDVDISRLPAGLYTAKIIYTDGTFTVRKFIKL